MKTIPPANQKRRYYTCGGGHGREGEREGKRETERERESNYSPQSAQHPSSGSTRKRQFDEL
jgi:hypothetical protein